MDALYTWWIDGQVANSGKPEGAFPSFNAWITWGGSSWHEPTVNRWDFIRYGIIATEHSGDFDSDGDHDLRDYRYLHECIERPTWPEFAAANGARAGSEAYSPNGDSSVAALPQNDTLAGRVGEYQPVAPGIPADPGCLWADIDVDGDVDLHDFAEFQVMFTGRE